METSSILNSLKPTYLGEENSHFSTVPNEILKIILHFLPRPLDLLFASRVCKRWRVICLDNVLQKQLDSLFLHKFLLNKANPSQSISTPLSPPVYFSHFYPFSAHSTETRALKKLYSSSDKHVKNFDFSNDHLAISYNRNNLYFSLMYVNYRAKKTKRFRFENEITEIFLDPSTQNTFFVEKQKGLKVMETDFNCYSFNKPSALQIKSKFNRCYFLEDKCQISFVNNKTNEKGVAISSQKEKGGNFKDFCLGSGNKIFTCYETLFSFQGVNREVGFFDKKPHNLSGWDIETSQFVTCFPTIGAHAISSHDDLLVSYTLSNFEVFDIKSEKEVFSFALEKKLQNGTSQFILEDFCLYSLTNGIFQVRDLRNPKAVFEPLSNMKITRFVHHNDIFLFLSDAGGLEFYSFMQKDNLEKLQGFVQKFASFFKFEK